MPEKKLFFTYFLTNFLASLEFVKARHFAVGIPCRSIKDFAQSLSASIFAPAFPGPKHGMPTPESSSAMPFAK